MPLNIQIKQLRLTIIWVETTTDLLGHPGGPNVLSSFLGDCDSYAATFDKVQKGGIAPMGLKAPWDKPAGQYFWTYYLEKRNLAYLKGDDAWRFLVPFRGRVPVIVTAPWLKGSFVLESFFYPHGFALVVTVTSQMNQTLDDIVGLAFKVKSNEKLDVQWIAGTKEQLYLNQLADKCMTNIRTSTLGPKTAPGMPSVEPFTIFTVVDGEPNAAPVEGDEIHLAMEALTTWYPNWKKLKLQKLDQNVKLTLDRVSPDSHVVYARKRGRVVWFPEMFTYKGEKRTSLSCYHRNLVFTSLQVESFCGLASATAKEISAGNWPNLHLMHRDCARQAVGILGRMYGGDRNTYRSQSPRFQIDQNSLSADVNIVRNLCGMPQLK